MSLTQSQLFEIKEATEKIARGVGVRGLINIQYAVAWSQLYVLEANPRASRTVPYVSKATGVQLAKAAARICVGTTIAQLRELEMLPNLEVGKAHGISVKEAVLPWNRFRRIDGKGVDSVLGPEMRSTGEVMGIADNFGAAYAKARLHPLDRYRKMVRCSYRSRKRINPQHSPRQKNYLQWVSRFMPHRVRILI